MIGNDIIDINQTRLNTNWQRKGFLQKVFNLEEQEIIHSSVDPFLAVWRLWSMKESAYKLLLQSGTTRFFNPPKLSCKIKSTEKGSLSINGFNINTSTTTHANYIHTTASFEGSGFIAYSIFHLTNDAYNFQSKSTHQKLLHFVAVKDNLEKSNLAIKKSTNQIPELFYKGQKLNISFSLSHHGNYGAFSILNN